jgi:hypothetical protein
VFVCYGVFISSSSASLLFLVNLTRLVEFSTSGEHREFHPFLIVGCILLSIGLGLLVFVFPFPISRWYFAVGHSKVLTWAKYILGAYLAIAILFLTLVWSADGPR